MFSYLFLNGLVQGGQIKELPVTQPGIYPVIDQPDLVFHQGLIFRLTWPGRDYSNVVMIGKVFKCAIDLGLIPVCFDDSGFEVKG